MSREEEANNPVCKENYADQSARLNRNLEELRHRITDQSGQQRRPRPSGLRPPAVRVGTVGTARVQMASLTTHPTASETVQSRAARLHLMSTQPQNQQSTQVIAARTSTVGRPRSPAASPREDMINILEAEFSAQEDNAGNVNVVQNRIQTAQYTPQPGIEHRPMALLNVSATQQPARQSRLPAPGRQSRLPTAPASQSRLPQARPAAVCPQSSARPGTSGIPQSRLPTKAGTAGQNVAGATRPAVCPPARGIPRPTGAIPKPAASRQSVGGKSKPASATTSKASVSAARRDSTARVCPTAGRPAGRKAEQTYYQSIAEANDEDLDFEEPPQYDEQLDVSPPPGTSNWHEEQFAMLEHMAELQQQAADPEGIQCQLNALMDVFEKELLAARNTQRGDMGQEEAMPEVCPAPAAATPQHEGRQSLSPRRTSMSSPAATTPRSPVCPTGARQSLSPRRESMGSPAAATPRSPVCPTEARQSLSPRRTSTSSPVPTTPTSPVCPTGARQSLSPRRESMGSPASATSRSPVCPTGARQSLSPRRESMGSPASATPRSPVCPPGARQSSPPRRGSMASPAAASPTSSVCPAETRQSSPPRRGSMASPAAASPTSSVCPAETRQSSPPRRGSMASPAAASPTSSVCPAETRQSSPPRRGSMASPAAASPTSTVCPAETRQSSPPRQRPMASPDTCLPDTTGVASRIPARSRLRPPSRIATAARGPTVCPPEAGPSASSQAKTTEASVAASRKPSTASVSRRQTVGPSKIIPPSGFGRTNVTARRQPADAAQKAAATAKSLGASRRPSTATVGRRQTLGSVRAGQPTEAALRVAASRKSLASSRQESKARVCPIASKPAAARRPSTIPPSGFGRTNVTARRKPVEPPKKAAEARKSLGAARSASAATVSRRQTVGPSTVPPSGFGRTNTTARRQPADAASRRASTATISKVPPSGFGRTNTTARRQPADAASRRASTATVSKVPPSGFGRTNTTARRVPVEARKSMGAARSASTAAVSRRQTIGAPGRQAADAAKKAAASRRASTATISKVPPSGFGRTNTTARRQPADAASRRASTATVSKVPPSGFGRTNTTARRVPADKSVGPHKLAKSVKKPTTSIQKRPAKAGAVCRTEPRSTKDVQRKVDSEILGGLKSRQQKANAQQQKNLKLLRSQVLTGGPGKSGKGADDKDKQRRASGIQRPSGIGKPKVPIKPPSIAAKKINKEIKKKVEESQKGKTPIRRPSKPAAKSEGAPAAKGAPKAGYDVPKAIPRRPLIKTEGIAGPPIERAQTDEAYKIMAMEKKGMKLTGNPKDVANLLVPSNEPKLKAIGNALESVNEGIVAANIPTKKINELNNLVTEEIGITLRSRPQQNPQTGLAAATLQKVSLQLPTAPVCDYLECEVVLSNFTIENHFQPRGTDMPKWFPGLYTILPGEKTVMARSSPSDTLMKAWTELKPDYLKV